MNTNPLGHRKTELLDTDLVILKHVALYYLTFRAALKVVLSSSDSKSDPGNALAALARRGYLRDSDSSGNPLKLGSRRYYLMGAKGRDLLGLPPERATETPDTALHTRLASLWFCCMEKERRYRLDKQELKATFGKHPPHHNTPHCVGLDEVGSPVVYRIYASSGEVRTIVRQARDYLDKARSNKTLRPWVESGDYGFAILVETDAKCERIRRELAKTPKRGAALNEEARFVVSLGPTPETLSLSLNKLRSKREVSP